MNRFDEQYHKLGMDALNDGEAIYNERTGKTCITSFGHMMKFDVSDNSIPLFTTKQVYYKQMVAELLGFIRGYDSADKFRKEGCFFWDDNANKSYHWLQNPNRKGQDDLGRIYGVQARDFNGVDQLENVIEKLGNRNDDRRLIVTHYNPAELDQMALPPCHLLYNFGLRNNDVLDLCMYQRSADLPLGVPMNVASYALLLQLIARITGLKPGTFTHFIWNAHIYEDQVDDFKKQMARVGSEKLPYFEINENIRTLKDLETWVSVDDFKVKNYEHDDPISYKFSE